MAKAVRPSRIRESCAVSNTMVVGGPGNPTPSTLSSIIVDGGTLKRELGNHGFSKIRKRGLVEVQNGHFHEESVLIVDGELNINRTLGSVSVGINSVQTVGRLTVGPQGTLLGQGTIRGKVNVPFGGTVLPGTSPGTLTIDGDYEQTGGLLGIEIAGTARGQFDVLAVTGNAAPWRGAAAGLC